MVALRGILECLLFNKALEYGGYDKIPVPVINESLRVAVATGIVLVAFAWLREKSDGIQASP